VREQWAATWAKLLKPGGQLVTLMFPVDPTKEVHSPTAQHGCCARLCVLLFSSRCKTQRLCLPWSITYIRLHHDVQGGPPFAVSPELYDELLPPAGALPECALTAAYGARFLRHCSCSILRLLLSLHKLMKQDYKTDACVTSTHAEGGRSDGRGDQVEHSHRSGNALKELRTRAGSTRVTQVLRGRCWKRLRTRTVPASGRARSGWDAGGASEEQHVQASAAADTLFRLPVSSNAFREVTVPAVLHVTTFPSSPGVTPNTAQLWSRHFPSRGFVERQDVFACCQGLICSSCNAGGLGEADDLQPRRKRRSIPNDHRPLSSR